MIARSGTKVGLVSTKSTEMAWICMIQPDEGDFLKSPPFSDKISAIGMQPSFHACTKQLMLTTIFVKR